MAQIKYRPAIDGLRAIAIISVFIFHLNHNWLPGGFVGVDVFFAISGFLITTLILKDCQKNCFSLANFYQRRIARIFPAFFTVGLATLIGAYFVYTHFDLSSTGANLTAAAMSLANVKYMLQGNYFTVSPDAQPFLHYWSLSVEEQFYMIFPLFFILLYKYTTKHRTFVVGCLLFVSLCFCIAMTYLKPIWAFYLLPTRGWELLAGCYLAIRFNGGEQKITEIRWSPWIPVIGLGLLALSFMLIHEGTHFPGFLSLLPVVGAVCLILPVSDKGGIAEKFLSLAPLVLIGRMSYSLYLWHWPIFSLIDYKMFFASEPTRLILKIILSLLVAALSFWCIENPARAFFNLRQNRTMAYSFFSFAVISCVFLGLTTHNSFYISVKKGDVAKGGLVINDKLNTKKVVLMGDSNGSMYGKLMKDICLSLGYRLIVISVEAGTPLPSSNGQQEQLWLDSLKVVRNEKPDLLILACHWTSKLESDKNRLELTLNNLAPHVKHLLILNQPPTLPETANRASIRQGVRPPFFEEPKINLARLNVNKYLDQYNNASVSVFDIASHFQLPGGEIRFLDDQGRQLFHDKTHLSGFGACLVRSDLERVIEYLSKLQVSENIQNKMALYNSSNLSGGQ